MLWSWVTMRFLRRKKKRTARCPECGNRKHNKELKPRVWRCASCYHTFVSDEDEAKRRVPKQIGVDIEDDGTESY